MDLKKKMKLLNAGLVVVLLPLLFGWIVGEEPIMMGSVVLSIVYVVIVRRLWRCPHCGCPLGRTDSKLTYCPHCGKHLGLD